jgi:hypothetical protein
VTIRWIAIAGCPGKLLPEEGELVAVYNGREQWLSRWKHVLADERLKGHITHFADHRELSLPYPPKEPKSGVEEDRVRTANRDLKAYHRANKR